MVEDEVGLEIVLLNENALLSVFEKEAASHLRLPPRRRQEERLRPRTAQHQGGLRVES